VDLRGDQFAGELRGSGSELMPAMWTMESTSAEKKLAGWLS
jgi:hypothetical protein